MPSRPHVVATCATAALALLVAATPATAAPKRITGKLSKAGYTVIAIAATGEAKSVRAKPRFRLPGDSQHHVPQKTTTAF